MKAAKSHQDVLVTPIQRALVKFGSNIRIARLKRNITAAQMAEMMGIHRSTYSRVEAGDPSVALGVYAGALSILGFDPSFASLADPFDDREGLSLDLQRLPKRASASARRSAGRSRSARPSVTPDVLRIGVMGSMSGPAGVWGRINHRCAAVAAELYNEQDGFKIDGQKMPIEIIPWDDRLSPSIAAEGARSLIEDHGVRYIIGPNVEQTLIKALPIAERHGAMLFAYSFTRSLYSAPHRNAVLAQIAGYQAVPEVLRYLISTYGAKSISLIAPSTPEGLRQRQVNSQIATNLGLQVLSRSATYGIGSEYLEQALSPVVAEAPDILSLSNVAPDDAMRMIRFAREGGFRGIITTESAQDVEGLIDKLGEHANGLVLLGGASVPETRSDHMNKFVSRYEQKFGVWNDEAGTKAYALEFILGTLAAAGKPALRDTTAFKATMPTFTMPDPLRSDGRHLAYFGDRDFRHKRQVGIPLVVNTVVEGRLRTVFCRSPEEILN